MRGVGVRVRFLLLSNSEVRVEGLSFGFRVRVGFEGLRSDGMKKVKFWP